MITLKAGSKNTYVGEFFEMVGHRLVGGELTRDDDGDICLADCSTTIDVKSTSNPSSYGFRLSVEQIRDYESRATFPFDRAWYMFFSYRNRKLRKTGEQHGTTEMSPCIARDEIHAFLNEHIEWCLIADLSIVQGWRDTLPHSDKSVIGRPGLETVDVKPAVAYSLTNGGLKEGLEAINIDPSLFAAFSFGARVHLKPDLFSDYYSSFPVRVVVPSSEARFTKKVFTRRGFDLVRERRF